MNDNKTTATTNGQGRARLLVVILALAAAAAMVTGCATREGLHQGGADPDTYNPETGYPLVGSASGSRI